jgi:cell wall-associated NlpC family hydrolase
VKRVLLALVLILLLPAMFTARASAAPPPPTGGLWSAVENTFTHHLTVTGYAYDPAAPASAVTVRLVMDGRYVTTVRADGASAGLDQVRHISGRHRFAVSMQWPYSARSLVLKSRGVQATAPLVQLAARSVQHYYPSASSRIVTVARRYVGARYVEGGASPSGFDCSGYTRYVYIAARVHTLTHNAESQREATRSISKSAARPGDLVFYMSGGSAYHVAIYAGHGWQYAAATVKDGVRYQPVWSSAVQYRTDWH